MVNAMVAKVVAVGVSKWRKFVAIARKTANHSAHGPANHRNVVRLAARSARLHRAQCVARASIRKVAGWNAANQIVESYAQKNPIFVQPRIALSARQSVPSQYAKWLARKA